MDSEANRFPESLRLCRPKHGIVSRSPAERWEDGLIVGNGTLGALGFGRTHREEIVLSHERLFLPMYPRHRYIHLAPHWERIRRLVMAGRGDEVMRQTTALAREQGYLERELTDPFIGACSLHLAMPESAVSAYARTVDFAAGEATVAWRDGGGLFHRRMFASRSDRVVVIQVRRLMGGAFGLTAFLRRIDREFDAELYERMIADAVVTAEPGFLRYSIRLRRLSADQRLRGYDVGVRVVQRGGTARVEKQALTISDSEEVLLLISIEPIVADSPHDSKLWRERLAAIEPVYDELLARHAVLHGELFGRLRFRLEAVENSLTTEELQSGSAVGQTSPALVQAVFDAGRYGIICSTGELPPALQGIWTGTWRPNWSGDFTLNGNVQSAVAASLPGNHFECLRATLDYLSGLLDDFRCNARELFGFRGIYVPWRASTHGQCHYAGVGREPDGSRAFPGMYWFAGTAWWAWHYYDYWLYTGDEEFFEKQLAPFFLEAAAFYEDYLDFEENGRLVLTPSYSPENQPPGGSCLQPNATMTIACLREFLRTALTLSDRFGVSSERRERWLAMFDRLPAYRVASNGALAEWSWPGVENNESHRHASHLYPLYNGLAPEIAGDAGLREACRRAILNRLEFRRSQRGGKMAFGLVQLGLAAAHLRDRGLAYECVEWLSNNYWSPALVSQHDPGRIFNLDISGGLPAVVLAMLIQSSEAPVGRAWQIALLPCLPESWPAGELRGVRCRGGFEVAFRWSDHVVIDLTVTGFRGEPCCLEYNGRRVDLTLAPGESWHG